MQAGVAYTSAFHAPARKATQDMKGYRNKIGGYKTANSPCSCDITATPDFTTFHFADNPVVVETSGLGHRHMQGSIVVVSPFRFNITCLAVSGG